ncbi:hypothetical protein CYY_002174 [Polysphondylium violaceum]|uniref:Uncharacterized protein n=1 Tax=Polysphondylium violaceum TaxID=133409 RepID=A0A8J4Q1P6_9MYCE|nr:hypothetical protein CYY_002174 [Polysphondylium violaceum]
MSDEVFETEPYQCLQSLDDLLMSINPVKDNQGYFILDNKYKTLNSIYLNVDNNNNDNKQLFPLNNNNINTLLNTGNAKEIKYNGKTAMKVELYRMEENSKYTNALNRFLYSSCYHMNIKYIRNRTKPQLRGVFIYSNDFFIEPYQSHFDSNSNHVMTIVVILPTDHNGGEMEFVENKGKTVKEQIDNCKSQIKFIAFKGVNTLKQCYSITNGKRVCLIYDIFNENNTTPPKEPPQEIVSSIVNKYLNLWFHEKMEIKITRDAYKIELTQLSNDLLKEFNIIKNNNNSDISHSFIDNRPCRLKNNNRFRMTPITYNNNTFGKNLKRAPDIDNHQQEKRLKVGNSKNMEKEAQNILDKDEFDSYYHFKEQDIESVGKVIIEALNKFSCTKFDLEILEGTIEIQRTTFNHESDIFYSCKNLKSLNSCSKTNQVHDITTIDCQCILPFGYSASCDDKHSESEFEDKNNTKTYYCTWEKRALFIQHREWRGSTNPVQYIEEKICKWRTNNISCDSERVQSVTTRVFNVLLSPSSKRVLPDNVIHFIKQMKESKVHLIRYYTFKSNKDLTFAASQFGPMAEYLLEQERNALILKLLTYQLWQFSILIHSYLTYSFAGHFYESVVKFYQQHPHRFTNDNWSKICQLIAPKFNDQGVQIMKKYYTTLSLCIPLLNSPLVKLKDLLTQGYPTNQLYQEYLKDLLQYKAPQSMIDQAPKLLNHCVEQMYFKPLRGITLAEAFGKLRLFDQHFNFMNRFLRYITSTYSWREWYSLYEDIHLNMDTRSLSVAHFHHDLLRHILNFYSDNILLTNYTLPPIAKCVPLAPLLVPMSMLVKLILSNPYSKAAKIPYLEYTENGYGR